MKSLTLSDFISPESNEKILAADKISITVSNLMDLVAVQFLGPIQFSTIFRNRMSNFQNKIVEIHINLFAFYDGFNPHLVQFLFSEFSLYQNIQAFNLIFSKNSYRKLDVNSRNLMINTIKIMGERGVSLHLTLNPDDFGQNYYDDFANEGSMELEHIRRRNDEISEALRISFLTIRSLRSLNLSGNEFKNFSRNELTELFNKFRECTYLERLSLRGCGIEKLTANMREILFKNLRHLQELDLTYNRCYELPFDEVRLLFSPLSVKKVSLFDNLTDIDVANINKIFKILTLFPKLEGFGNKIGINGNKRLLEEKRLAIISGLNSLKELKLLENDNESAQPLINLINTFYVGINGSSLSGLPNFAFGLPSINLGYLPSGVNDNNNNLRLAPNDEERKNPNIFKS